MTLVERAGLWTEDRKAATREAERRIKAAELSVVRLAFADQHGVLRGKTLTVGEVDAALKNGVGFTTTMLLKDTSHRTVFPVWQPGGGFGMKELEGAADVIMLPDPTTFRVLPWALHSGWMLCDIHFADGRPMPLCTRHICRQCAQDAGRPRLRFRRRPRSRVPSLQAGGGKAWRCRRRPARRTARRVAAQPGLPVPDRAALRRDGPDPGDPAHQHRRSRPAVALHRGRVRAEPGRVHLPHRHRPGAGRRHGAVQERHQAGGAAPRLSRHLHVPAQARQRHVERLAPAPVADRQEEPRQRLHGRTRTAVGDGQPLHGGTSRPCTAGRPPSARRP